MRRSGEDSLLVEWRERVGRFDAAGLSVVEFCRQEGVSQGRFYYWRRKLRQEGAAARSRSNRSSGRSAFVPVEVRGVVGEVVIEFPSGVLVQREMELRLVGVVPNCLSEMGDLESD